MPFISGFTRHVFSRRKTAETVFGYSWRNPGRVPAITSTPIPALTGHVRNRVTGYLSYERSGQWSKEG